MRRPSTKTASPFVRVSGLLAAAGVHVPRVHAQDLQQGFCCWTIWARPPIWPASPEDKARALYPGRHRRAGADPASSRRRQPAALRREALLTREMNLFPEWFASRHLGKPFDDTLTVWKDAQRLLLDAIQAQPRVLVHPRLPLPQPDGEPTQPRRAGFSGRGVVARSPTTWCRC